MTSEERMARAGDYVLGLMDDAERTRAERDLVADPAFRECVLQLAERFHAFDRDAEPETVREDMWHEIAARIAEMPQMSTTELAEARLAETGFKGPDTERKGFLGIRRPGARALGGVRGMLLAACLLAACGVGYLAGQASVSPSDPVVVVILSDESQVPGAFVEAYGNDVVRIVPLRDFDVPEGKVLEAWTLYDHDVGPVSLGTFGKPMEVTLQGPDQPPPQAEQLYEITLEDAPRSSTGRPTGPILAKGLAVTPPR